MKRYKLSRVLEAIQKDSPNAGVRWCADTVRAYIIEVPSDSFEDALKFWPHALPAVVGMGLGDPPDDIAAALVAEAKRLNVPMEEC